MSRPPTPLPPPMLAESMAEGARRARLPRWTGACADHLGVPLALIALLFLGYYRRWAEFGLYGDDAGVIGGSMLRSWSQECDYLLYCLTKWPAGRPLGDALNLSLVPYVASRLGGLPGLHVVAFAVMSANAVLLYRLIARTFSPVVAFATGAFYCLSPASTVHLQLVFVYHFEIAFLVALLAANAAVDGRQALFAAYVAIAFTMYESVAMFALVVPPFLTLHRRQGWRSRTVRHVAVWGLVVACVLIARRLIGDPWGGERVGEMASAPLTTLRRGIQSVTTGITTHASLLGERLVLPLRTGEHDGTTWRVLAVSFIVALGALAWLKWRAQDRRKEDAKGPALAGAAVLTAAGLLAMAGTYFTYFRPPWNPAAWRWGFMSGVHVVAASGAALVLAGVVQAALAAVPARLRWPVLLAPALALALLCGFGDLVQREYVRTWQTQKEFWHAFRHLCRDATARTYVLVLDRNLPAQRYVELFSWGSEVLPDSLFVYPEPSKASTIDPGDPGPWASVGRRAPSVILTGPDPASTISYSGGSYHWKPSPYFMLPKGEAQRPTTGNVILLERRAEGWRRIEGVVPVDGGDLTLRPAVGDLLDHLPITALGRAFGL